MAFEGLTEKIAATFKKLRGKGRLKEADVKEAMREIRMALLEADVSYKVVKDFTKSLTERCVGADVLESLTPAQMIVKIVNEELCKLMGSDIRHITINPNGPTVVMLVGLQGAGKTTNGSKLAGLMKRQGKNPLLVACDIYRPAAITQLKVCGEKLGIPVFEMGQIDPLKIVKGALAEAGRLNYDTLIVDTAGRLHIDAELMKELADLKAFLNPTEILLVVDSMTGQDAVNVATEFNKLLDITGVIVTKLDGDTRGGAALSIKAVTGKPIKFSGTGEKMEDIETFHPDRMASRILGMGDVLTLIDKAQAAYTEEEAKKFQEKLRSQDFTLTDYLDQFDRMKKMGSMQEMMGMIPGLANKMRGQDLTVDEDKVKHMKAIILSMTPYEREHADVINGKRKKRIAAGAGVSIQEVNQLLKQYEMTRDMMKRMMRGGMKKMKFPF